MIIDVHGHLVPPELLAEIRKGHGRFNYAHARERRWSCVAIRLQWIRARDSCQAPG